MDFQKAFDSIWHEGLFLKLIESGVGGKHDIIKSMYSNSKCVVKISEKRTTFFTQRHGVRQGCSLSPTLFNIYINELAKQLEQSAAPGLTLHDSNVQFLLYADDLVLLSPTEEGLQQNILEKFCQTWALTINPHKNKVLVFQKRSRPQKTKQTFNIGITQIQQITNYTYLGIKISSTGNFNLAVNELKENARNI